MKVVTQVGTLVRCIDRVSALPHLSCSLGVTGQKCRVLQLIRAGVGEQEENLCLGTWV